MWHEDDTHTSNIWFHDGIDPRNMLKDKMEEQVHDQISPFT